MSYIETPYTQHASQVVLQSIKEREPSYAAMIIELYTLCHHTANVAGWWINPKTGEPKSRNFGEMISLMHSELSEALEGDRKSLMSDKIPQFTSVEEEFADALIRIFDCAGAMQLRLGAAFMAKLQYNQQREDHKIENRAKDGGKDY